MSRTLGWHWTAELGGCPPAGLADPQRLSDAMTAVVEQLGLRAVAPPAVRRTDHGAVGVLLLAESHVAIHTWPSRGIALVDLFSCVPFDEAAARRLSMQALDAETCSATLVERGSAP